MLSFPPKPAPKPGSRVAGDLAISVETARRQAAEQGHALGRELKVLILHGLLHLAGYDHEADAGQMRRRERSLARKLGLPQGLIERHPSKRELRIEARARDRRSPSIRRYGSRSGQAFDGATADKPLSACCDGAANHDPARNPPRLLLAAVATLASYINRVYSEFGKILSREVQENLDAWETRIEPHLGLSREHAALCAAVLQQLALGIIALDFGALLFIRPTHPGPPTAAEIAQAILAVVLVVVFAYQLIPSLLFNRTRGLWAARLLWPIRLLLWFVTPVTVFVRFFFSVAALAEAPASPEEETAVDVEALIEAGEEEGILEESDRDLVRSAVEFGDKLVREVMTPRPEVFAVPESTTLEHFLELLRQHNFSRVPVYSGSLDNITGLAFAHDLLQITDEEARTRTVADHPAPRRLRP